MKKVKALLALLLAAVMVMALAACGGEDTEPKITAPVITSQPEDQSVDEDTLAKFTVEATGGSLSYQWYYRASPDGDWKACSLDTATTATLKVKAIPDRNGNQYMCTVSNAEGSVDTAVATLTVTATAAPVITSQPEDQTAPEDTLVKFTVEATGGPLTYQWYYRASPTGEWKKSSLDTATTATLKVTAIPDRSGNQYKCVVSNAAGSTDSEPATLTVG